MRKKRLYQLGKQITALILCVILSLAGVESLSAAATTTPPGTENSTGVQALEEDLSNFLVEKVDLENAVGIIENENTAKNELLVQLDDGTTMAYMFSEDIKYEDENGEIKYKDTTIQTQGNSDLQQEGYEYTNGENDVSIEFSEDTDIGVKLSSEDTELTLSPVHMGLTDKQAGEPSETTLNETEAVFTYEGVFGEGSRVEYLPQLNGLKENIVLEEYSGINSFDFILDTQGDHAELVDDRIIVHRGNSADLVNVMAPLFAFDSHEDATDTDSVHYTEDCTYALTELSDGTYKVTVTVSEDWLTAATTVYPVTIDPTVEHTGSIATNADCALYLGTPNGVFNTATTNSVGRSTGTYSTSTYKKGRAMFKFLFPSAVKRTEVLNANYYFYETSERTTSTYIGAHMINADADGWTEATATWNLYADAYEATQQSRRLVSSGGWHSFGIKVAAQKWANGSHINRGIMLVSEDEDNTSITSWRSFCSQRHGTSAQRPYGAIQYQADEENPVIESVTKVPSEWTKGSVKLVVNATDNAGVKEYSFSNSSSTYNWQPSKTSQEYSSNQTVYVSVRDYSGRSSSTTVNITNIDTTAPAISKIKSVINKNGSMNVTVTATDSQSGIASTNGYSFNGGSNWQTDKSKKFDEVASNFSVKVRDKLLTTQTTARPGVIITGVSQSSEDWTTSSVTVTVNATSGSAAMKDYSFDGGDTWQTSISKTFTQNEAFEIVARNANNDTCSMYYEVTNIDTDAPKIAKVEKTYDKEGVMSLVIIAYDHQSGIMEYSFDNGVTWQEENAKIYEETPSFLYVKVKDRVGNIASYNPVIISSITYSSNDWTTNNITVIINAIPGSSPIKDYSFDGGDTWQTGNSFIFTDHEESVPVAVRDNGNNVWAETLLEIKIDRDPPEIDPYIDVVNDDYPMIFPYTNDPKSGVSLVKYEAGVKNVNYFQSEGSVLSEETEFFDGEFDAEYTIYAKDVLGNEGVQTMTATRPSDEEIEADAPIELESGNSDHENYGDFNTMLSSEKLAKYYVVRYYDIIEPAIGNLEQNDISLLNFVSLGTKIPLFDANDCVVASAYNYTYQSETGYIIVSLYTGSTLYYVVDGETLDDSMIEEPEIIEGSEEFLETPEPFYWYFENLFNQEFELYLKNNDTTYCNVITDTTITSVDFEAEKGAALSEFESRDSDQISLLNNDNLEQLVEIDNQTIINESNNSSRYGDFHWGIDYENVAKYYAKKNMLDRNPTISELQDISVISTMPVYDENNVAIARVYNFATEFEENSTSLCYIIISTHTKQSLVLDFTDGVNLTTTMILYYINNTFYYFNYENEKFYNLDQEEVGAPIANYSPFLEEAETMSSIQTVKNLVNSANHAVNPQSSDFPTLSVNGQNNTDHVVALQYLMLHAGYNISITGIFDNETGAAVSDLQSDQNYVVTGIADHDVFSFLIDTAGYPKKSDRNLAVVAVQHLLSTRHEYDIIKKDGNYGQYLKNIIDDFQERCAISSTSVVSYDTWKYLFGPETAPEPEISLMSTSTGKIANQTYYIFNVATEKYLDLDPNHLQACQWGFTGYANQMWRVVYSASNDAYKIVPIYAEMNRNSTTERRLRVHIPDGKTGKEDLYIAAFEGTGKNKSSWWKIQEISGAKGKYWLRALCNTNKALTVVGNNTYLQHRSLNYNTYGARQRWRFIKVYTKLSNYKVNGTRKKMFAGFDVSNDATGSRTIDEVGTFRSGMLNLGGYMDVATLNNDWDYRSPRTFRAVTRAVDVAYLNSHGSRFGSLPFYRYDASTGKYSERGALAPGKGPLLAKNISTSGLIVIGMNFRSDGFTYSQFTKNTKWLVLGGCSQLNIGTKDAGSGNEGYFYQGQNTAHFWARTMLGKGNMVHGILGFSNLGLGGDLMRQRMSKFLFHQLEYQWQTSAIASWHNAFYNSTWAAIVRSDCTNENFLTNFSNKKNRVPIYYYSRAFGNVVLMSKASKTYSESGTTYSIHKMDSKTTTATNFSLVEDPFSVAHKNLIRNVLCGDSSYDNRNAQLNISDNGRLLYKREIGSSGEPVACNFDKDQAIEEAKAKLIELDLLPTAGYRVDVDSVQGMQMDMNFFAPENTPETIQYNVRFYPVLDGKDILTDQNDRIVVSFDHRGITSIEYFWRKILQQEEPIVRSSATTSPTSRESQAVDACLEKYQEIENRESSYDIVQSEAFIYTDEGLKSAWVFGQGEYYLNPIIIDINTGEEIDAGEVF